MRMRTFAYGAGIVFMAVVIVKLWHYPRLEFAFLGVIVVETVWTKLRGA